MADNSMLPFRRQDVICCGQVALAATLLTGRLLGLHAYNNQDEATMSKLLRYIMLLVGCSALIITMIPGRAVFSQADTGVATITGKFTITNQDLLGDATEPAVVLFDMTAFVKRDFDMPLKYNDQPMGVVEGDMSKGATYTLSLPIVPRAALNDVSNGKGSGKGIMIFAVFLNRNSIGDPYIGPYEGAGWPGYDASILADPGTIEVVSGKLVVWSPDDTQMFPTGFGDDGKLFTKDDPVGPITHGWTVIDLDKKPFAQIRTETVDIPIQEGLGAQNDLSKLTYTQAFDALIKDLRIRYVFTELKKIDWDALSKEFRPQIQKAEQDKSKDEFEIALTKFVAKFHDGHVGVQTPQQYFADQTAGGLGLVLGQTDDGVVIARIVVDNLPAAEAGIKTAATITQWNGKPIEQALADTELIFAPQSSPISTRIQQLRYIERGPVGTKYQVTYQNPGDSAPKTAELTSVAETQSRALSSINRGVTADAMPLTFKVIQQGDSAYGYVQINTFFGDEVLLNHTWEWIVSTAQQLQIPSLIVDARHNGGGWGGSAVYMAGSFYTKSFILNKAELADKAGKFLYVGSTRVDPAPVQWTAPVAVLVGPACFSACEIFAASMAHDPNHLIVGRYPTAGVEAGVEPWTLPDNAYFQAPTERLVTPDNQIFLEGVGVQPNVKVPVTVESLLSSDDQELAAAEKALDVAVAKASATEAPTAQATESAATTATPEATLSATMAATQP